MSLVDLTVHLDKATSLDQIIQAFQESSQGYMEHIMHVESDELVSCDFQGSSYSAIIDAKACVELNPRVNTAYSSIQLKPVYYSLTHDSSSLKFLLGMIMSGLILQDCLICYHL